MKKTRNMSRELLIRTCIKNFHQLQSQKFQETSWSACCIWLACRLFLHDQIKNNESQSHAIGNGVKLAYILKESNLNLMWFMTELKQFIELADFDGLSFDCKNFLLIAIQKVFNSYTVVSSIHARFLDLFKAVTRFGDHRSQKGSFDENEKFLDELSLFTWILFLLAKDALPQENLKQSQALLAAIVSISFVVSQMPSHYRRPFSEVITRIHPSNRFNSTKNVPLPNGPLTPELESGEWLQHLEDIKLWSCFCFEVNYQDLLYFEKEYFVNLVTNLSKSGVLSFSSMEAFQYTALYPKFNSMIDAKVKGFFPNNTISLNNHYEFHLNLQVCDFDGRVFEQRARLLETPRKKSTPKALFGVKSVSCRSLIPSLKKASVYSHSMTSTPLTAKGLGGRSKGVDSLLVAQRNMLAHLDPMTLEIPESILRSFSHVSNFPASLIKQNADAVIVSLRNKDPSSIDYWKMGMKLYYNILDSALNFNLRQYGQENFSILSNDDMFHRSLMACSLELVRHCFNINTTNFEEMLHILNLKQFDFCLIVDFVIRSQTSLPWVLVKRLKEIEERILESQAWKDTNPLYNLMSLEADTSTNMLSCKNALIGQSSNQNPFYGDILRSVLDMDEVVYPPDTTKPKRRVGPLEIFFRKLFVMIRDRLQCFCTSMKLSPEVFRKTWNVLVYIVDNEVTHRLLHKRHVDIIIICAIFGSCRMSNIDISFKKILNSYRRQPQFTDANVRSVYTNDNEPEVDVIIFYNKIFLPKCKLAIHHYTETPNQHCTYAPVSFDSSTKTPQKGSIHSDILPFVSPVQKCSSQFPHQSLPLLTPISSKLYNYGESPGSGLTPTGKTPRKQNQVKPPRRLNFQFASPKPNAVSQFDSFSTCSE